MRASRPEQCFPAQGILQRRAGSSLQQTSAGVRLESSQVLSGNWKLRHKRHHGSASISLVSSSLAWQTKKSSVDRPRKMLRLHYQLSLDRLDRRLFETAHKTTSLDGNPVHRWRVLESRLEAQNSGENRWPLQSYRLPQETLIRQNDGAVSNRYI